MEYEYEYEYLIIIDVNGRMGFGWDFFVVGIVGDNIFSGFWKDVVC